MRRFYSFSDVFEERLDANRQSNSEKTIKDGHKLFLDFKNLTLLKKRCARVNNCNLPARTIQYIRFCESGSSIMRRKIIGSRYLRYFQLEFY